MKREFLKELELQQETIDKIMAEHGKSINDYKEKADKADTLESQIEDLNNQIADRDKQLKDLSKKAEGNEDLQQTIKDLQKQNDDAQKEYEDKIQQIQKESKLELALKDAKARNPKAVKALLDDEKISIDGDNLIGLKEQLDSLQESDAYLFESDEPAGLKGRQPQPAGQNQPKGVTKEDFEKMGYTERVKLYQEQPELYQELKGE